jgi:hypothetical protein
MAIAILGVFAICALTPALASAAINVPPGATEGDQYFEEVPNGGGSRSVDSPGGGSGGTQGVAAAQALNALGPDGQAAAGLAAANKPPRAGTQAGNSEEASSSSEGEGGMGAWFPILLAVTALGAIAYGLRRRLTPA